MAPNSWWRADLELGELRYRNYEFAIVSTSATTPFLQLLQMFLRAPPVRKDVLWPLAAKHLQSSSIPTFLVANGCLSTTEFDDVEHHIIQERSSIQRYEHIRGWNLDSRTHHFH